MTSLRISLSLLALLGASQAFAQKADPPIIARAREWVEKRPSVERRIGLAELQRAQGLPQPAFDQLHKAAAMLPAGDPREAPVRELLCWRMLPVTPQGLEVFN